MSDANENTDDALDETNVLNDTQTNAVSSNYKVLGYNQTGSGTTYGVLGQVDSSDGYGLYSPDDVKIEGTATGTSTPSTPTACCSRPSRGS